MSSPADFLKFLDANSSYTERASFVPTRELPSYPLLDLINAALDRSQEDVETTTSQQHPASATIDDKRDIYVLSVDQQIVGYKRSYKAALRAVNKLKKNIRLSLGWDVWYQWVEWKPNHEDEQRFVLEWRPLNNAFITYARREHEITLNRVKYFE